MTEEPVKLKIRNPPPAASVILLRIAGSFPAHLESPATARHILSQSYLNFFFFFVGESARRIFWRDSGRCQCPLRV